MPDNTRATGGRNVETIVLVISVAKWAALAGIAGVLGGAAVAAFLVLLEWGWSMLGT